jgi:uncharacterized membrane protein YraQ (UPF0718 family)
MKPAFPTVPVRDGSPAAARRPEYLPLLFLLAAVAFAPLGAGSDTRSALAIVFISIVLEAIPFMLVGSLVGGLIEVFVSRDRIMSLMPENGRFTVLLAAGAGMLFPVCECAVVPVVRRLVGKGMPLSAAVAYLLAGPIVNPIVAASTAMAYAFDWRVVALRLALGYGIAVVIGIAMGRFFRGREAFVHDTAPDAGCACGCAGAPDSHYHGDHHTGLATGPFPQSLPQAAPTAGGYAQGTRVGRITGQLGAAVRHATDDFSAVAHYLVIGAFIAALAQTYVSRAVFVNIGDLPFVSVAVMMGLAVLLNLCSEADAFISASFRGLVSLPAQMAFMLTGPMFDLKLLLMYQRLFRRRAIIVLAAMVLAAVFAVSVGFEAVNGVRP